LQLLPPSAAIGEPRYRVVDLGSLGGDYSVGLDVNNNGQVTGYSTTAAGHTHAFLYSAGVMTDLGTLGGTESYGRSINDNGQVVGDSLTSGGSTFSRAFLYNGGPLIDLGTLGGSGSGALGINNSGQITGGATLAGDFSNNVFLYNGGGLINLGSFGSESGRNINSAGQVIFGTFLWTPDLPNGTTGTAINLGSLGGGGTHAFGINDIGQVTGYSTHLPTGDIHVFLYSGGSMIDLGLGRGTAINNLGQVVGGEHVGDPVFLYSDGERFDLNALIDPASGWVLETAWSINDSGWITGRGSIGGTGHAYLLIPVPEPSSLVLVGLAMLAFHERGFRYRLICRAS
jgi:probable HAF family extracellular repeat protein